MFTILETTLMLKMITIMVNCFYETVNREQGAKPLKNNGNYKPIDCGSA